MDLIDQRVTCAHVLLRIMLERSVHSALVALGLPADCSQADSLEQELMASCPRYVATVVLRGLLWHDVYEGHPGLAHFSTGGSKRFEAPPYCTLSAGMELALKHLADAQVDADEDIRDGLFCPTSIVLLDQFDQAMQEHADLGQRHPSWLVDVPPAHTWAELEEHAGELDAEAALEAGWDNFETARHLRELAAAARRRIQIARGQSLAIL